MIVREKFSAKEWRRAFAKHSQLGYPSDDSFEAEAKEIPFEMSDSKSSQKIKFGEE